MEWIKLSEPELSGVSMDDFELALQHKEVGYTGSFVDSFRNQLIQYFDSLKVGLFASGTASIHLALKLAGVGEGDEVICQSLTFAASANPIRYLGANPVFVGSEGSTWNMSPEYLEKALADRHNKGKRVKAIVPVHLYGMPAQMDEINRIALQYNVPVIEDAAEALGSTLREQKCGALGDYGILSFNANKIITTGGGGAIITKNEEELEKARFLSLQAKDPAPHYQHSQLGYNYAFSNLNAVLGNAQFKTIEERIEKRRGNFLYYRNNLQDVTGLSFQEGDGNRKSNRWLTSMVLPSRELCLALKSHLEAHYIETRPIWKPMHLQPLYKGFPYYGERLEERLFYQGICLPSGSGLTQVELEQVKETVRLFLDEKIEKKYV
ncbi:aminotransferase class I/II-fold pyridoxal phosphate-dependent enzyme [Echinicola sediminis]